MARKSQQLQIRLTPEEKTTLKRRAARAGQDLSSYVLARALPPGDHRFDRILRVLVEEPDPRFVLAELNDFLSGLAPVELTDAVASADLEGLSPFLQNYVAAMVEVAAGRKDVAPPAWTGGIRGLDEPWFATSMKGLHLHLLRASPVPFKRRNLFVDATVGDRV